MNIKGGIVAITVRSFVLPDDSISDFDFGKGMEVKLSRNPDVSELIQEYFSRNAGEIGLILINGKKGDLTSRLSWGDRVDLYGLIGGG